jgi:2-iminobutanoate/2-iminopropanoate deaminase
LSDDASATRTANLGAGCAESHRPLLARDPCRQSSFRLRQIPIDPATGAVVDGDVSSQTDRVMRNIGALLEAAGCGFEHVVRTTVFLVDLNDFVAMNEVYGRFVLDPPPARATVQVSRLPRDVRVEIDAIAVDRVIQKAKY